MFFFFFFFKQKTAYEIFTWLEFRRVLFRSGRSGLRRGWPEVEADLAEAEKRFLAAGTQIAESRRAVPPPSPGRAIVTDSGTVSSEHPCSGRRARPAGRLSLGGPRAGRPRRYARLGHLSRH